MRIPRIPQEKVHGKLVIVDQACGRKRAQTSAMQERENVHCLGALLRLFLRATHHSDTRSHGPS